MRSWNLPGKWLTKLSPAIWHWGGLAMGTILVLGGTILRFWALNRQSLWQDEIHTAIYVADRPGILTVIYRVATWDLHSPLYYMLLRLQVWLLDVFHQPWSEGNLRLLSAVLGSAALLSLLLLLRQAFSRPVYSLGGLFLAAFNIYAIYYSQELRMYALILFLAPLVIYFQVKLYPAPGQPLRKWLAAGFVISAVALMYSSLIGLFFVFGIWCSLMLQAWLDRKSAPRQWLEVFYLGCLILSLYSPWLGVMWRQSAELKQGVCTGMVIRELRELFKFAFENLYFHSWKVAAAYGPINKLIRLVLPLALLNLLDEQKRRTHGLMLMGFALAFLTYYAVTFNKAFHTGRYFAVWWPYAMYLLPAAFSGLAVGLKKINQHLGHLGWVMMIICCGVYGAVQIPQVKYYFQDFIKEQWREAVPFLHQHWKKNDVLVVWGDWHWKNFTYYKAALPYCLKSDLEAGRIPKNAQRLIYVGDEKDLPRPSSLYTFQLQNWPYQKSLSYYIGEKK